MLYAITDKNTITYDFTIILTTSIIILAQFFCLFEYTIIAKTKPIIATNCVPNS